ncbi:MAG TPA: flagellar basal body rod C-terminal domain-containing protein [Mycobacteriales bacterium]|nr:flagellar basal body rod C-terminal domain-containing protein [Mycobacteriales bacterium]
MGPFDAMDIATTGASVSQQWLDAVANNVANVNTIRPAGQQPFRAELVVAQSAPNGEGVVATGVAAEGGNPAISYDPGNPLADAKGFVTHPVDDLSQQMADMIASSRMYEMNLNVMGTATETYQHALQIGDKL